MKRKALFDRSIKQNKGFALGELVIAVLIFGIVALGTAYAYNQYVSINSVNTTLDNSTSINATMKTLVSSPNYGNSDYGLVLARNNAFDTSAYGVSIVGNVATITNRWGGAVTVTGNNTNYIYVEPNVPAQVCAGLLPKLQRAAWSEVKVGATTLTVPVTATQAATNCTTVATLTLTSNG